MKMKMKMVEIKNPLGIPLILLNVILSLTLLLLFKMEKQRYKYLRVYPTWTSTCTCTCTCVHIYICMYTYTCTLVFTDSRITWYPARQIPWAPPYPRDSATHRETPVRRPRAEWPAANGLWQKRQDWFDARDRECLLGLLVPWGGRALGASRESYQNVLVGEK